MEARISGVEQERHPYFMYFGIISQLGYVVAYGSCGLVSDGIAKYKGITVGRGSAMVIMMSGVMLAVLSIVLYLSKSVKKLEQPIVNMPL